MKRLILLLLTVITLAMAIPVAIAQRYPMPYAKIQFFDRNGNPLSGGRLWSYVAGTTTPLVTYSSSDGAANTNPVVLDTAGRASVWLSGAYSYKLILEDSTCAYRDIYGSCHGVQQWSVDSVTDYGALLAAGESGSMTLDGDVEGAYNAATVVALQGIAVSETDPTAGQVLKYSSGAWTPGTVYDYIDFTGTSSSLKTFTLPNQDDTIATYDYANVFTAAQMVAPVTLTVAGDGTIATDADESNLFRVTLTTSCPCTLSTPTNPTNGQIATWEVIQATGGSETMAFSSAFAFGTTVTTPTITVTANKRDFVTAVYNSTATKWYVLYVTQGY